MNNNEPIQYVSSELPAITIRKSKRLIDLETDNLEINIKGTSLEECYNTLIQMREDDFVKFDK